MRVIDEGFVRVRRGTIVWLVCRCIRQEKRVGEVVVRERGIWGGLSGCRKIAWSFGSSDHSEITLATPAPELSEPPYLLFGPKRS